MEIKESFKKDVMVLINGSQKIDGEKDSVEMMVVGRFYQKNGAYYIRYDESESTGFEGCRTTLKVEDNNKVTLTRKGAVSSQLIIEKGRRHQCHYDTGYGMLTVGVSGDKISSTLSKEGGVLDFSYSLDINTALTSENRVIITIKESAEC